MRRCDDLGLLPWLGTGPGGGGGAGILEVASWADRPTSPSDGDQVYFTDWRAAFTFTSEGGGKWLPSAWVRDDTGAPLAIAQGADASANPLRLYAGGPAIPVSWTQDGANSVDPDAVRIARYVYVPTPSTAPRVILYAELASLPPAGTGALTNVGCIAGSVRGGVDRIAGVVFRGDAAPIPLDLGRYGTPQTAVGQAFGEVGTPIWVLLDLQSADSPCAVTDKDSPSLGIQSERSLISLATAWFELMNMDSASNAMPTPLELRDVVVFDVG